VLLLPSVPCRTTSTDEPTRRATHRFSPTRTAPNRETEVRAPAPQRRGPRNDPAKTRPRALPLGSAPFVYRFDWSEVLTAGADVEPTTTPPDPTLKNEERCKCNSFSTLSGCARSSRSSRG